MKYKSITLLLVFTFSLIPFHPTLAKTKITNSLEDALLLMLTSDAVLLDSGIEQDLSALHNLSAPTLDEPAPDLDDATMAAILQALKEWRNDLDKNCNLLTSQYRSEGKDCEADRIQATCDQYRQRINTEIGIYHDLRGDKRKAPTKIWHFLKRNGQNLWHKVGPVGRTFLRRLGPEVAQVVLSGGTMTGGALRKLVKQVARSIGREKIQKIVFQGVERLLKGQIEILQAAGVDLCDPDAQKAELEEIEPELVGDSTGSIPDGATWICEDVEGMGWLSRSINPESAYYKLNYKKEDHWIRYDESSDSLEYLHSWEYSYDMATIDVDGVSIAEWNTTTPSAYQEIKSIALDDYGIFSFELTFRFAVDDQFGYREADYDARWHFWGLIPPDNIQTVYLCHWPSVLEIPSDLEKITPDNFRMQCGPEAESLGSHYYQCTLTDD